MKGKTIHKQRLKLITFQTLTLPQGAELLKVAMQGDDVQLWYAFPIENHDTKHARQFEMVGTGRTVQGDGAQHIDTVLMDPLYAGGMIYVWHVFEIDPTPVREGQPL